MVKPVPKDTNVSLELLKEIIENYSISAPTKVTLLPAGYENLLFRLETNQSDYVLRLTAQRTCDQLEQEVMFVNRVRGNGFTRVPKFLQSKTGQYSLALEGKNATLYEYILGDVNESLTDSQFEVFAKIAPSFFIAKAGIAPIDYGARGLFPSPADVLTRLKNMCAKRSLNLDSFLRDHKLDSEFLSRPWPLTYDAVIHGDLHAGNFLWQNQTTFSGLLDFDDCCIGNDLIEFFALVRGICFHHHTLQVTRLSTLIKVLDPIFKFKTYGSSQLVDRLLYVLTYFALVMNEPRIGRTNPDLDYEDILRAKFIVENRTEVAGVFQGLNDRFTRIAL